MARKLFRTVGRLVAFVTAVGCRGQTQLAAGGSHPPEEREIAWTDLPKSPGPTSEASPATLTASDGTGLELVTFHARAKVEGPIAFTELHMEFENPSQRILEGTFSLALPHTAKVHRFAMKVDGAFQEGEIVGEEKARQTYESFLHRRVDPALLEHDEGNRFKARVFPIAPKARKEIVISYSEILESSQEGYRLALRGLPTLDELDVRVVVGGSANPTTYHLKRDLFTPDRDLVLPAMGDSTDVARSGELAAVRIKTPQAPASEAIGDVSILVDTSASRVGELAGAVKELSLFLKEASKRGVRRVRVVCFDQDLAEIYDGPASGFGERQAAEIVARGAAGATNFANALATVTQNGPRRILVLSDGIATAGKKAGSAVMDQSLAAGVERVDVALSGSPKDAAMANRLSVSGRRSGLVLERGLGAPEDRARLASQSASPIKIRVSNSRFVYPEVIPATAAGGEAVVFAELTQPGPFVVSINGEQRNFGSWVDGSGPLLTRMMAGARIDKLKGDYDTGTDESMRERIRRRMISLAREHGVLGPFTSLLVLETDADYARFGIDRMSPSQFMAVDDAGRIAVAAHPRPGPFGGSLWPSGMVPRGADTPDLDRDADGISDARDRCPTDPETYNGFNDEDGCPDKGKVIIEGSDILILDKIMFRNGTDAVAPESMPLVDAMAATMKHHPEFLKVEISGHTDSTGGPMRNQRLSERRARAVLELLVKKGIDPHRLVAVGYGGACPITKELSEADREKNRRVEFKVLETEDGLTGVWTCAQAKRRPGEPQRVPSTWMESRPLQVRHVADPSENSTPGLEGDALSIQKLLDDQHPKDALPLAIANRDAHPRDSLAWVELGNVFALGSEPGKAARAYGSLIDLGNDSAEMRRAAGGLLEFAASVGAKTDAGVAARALDLAVESYRAALERRPDHPSSYRLLAFALARQGKYDEAFRVLYDAYGVRFRPDLAPAKPILAGDLGVIGAALAAKDSASDDFVRRRLASLGVRWPTLPSLRFVLTWETDASDVNLYVKTNEAWRSTESSGSNLRDGYGPEQIVVDPSELPARIGVRLTRRGPQGHALGKVDVVYADAAGNLVFDARPFAVQREGGYVALGEFALGAK